MTIDMFGEKVAEASALIREFAKADYWNYFARDMEGSLESFIAMLDQAEEKGRMSQAARIAELEAQIAAASAPAVEQQPEWEDFDIEKTGDDHYDAGNFLLNAAQEFWNACRRAQQYGAVQWLTGENGELLIYTRGEYRERLMLNIEAMGPTKHFKVPQPADTDKLREAMTAWESLRADVLHGPDGLDNDQVNIILGMIDHYTPTASTALQAPVREVPEGWRLVPVKATEEWKDRLRDNGYCPTTVIDDVLTAAPLADELPGMWEQADLTGGATDCMPLPAAPVQQEGE